MKNAFAALLLLSLIGACSDKPRKLAQPDGPVFRLNPHAWEDAERYGFPPDLAAR